MCARRNNHNSANKDVPFPRKGESSVAASSGLAGSAVIYCKCVPMPEMKRTDKAASNELLDDISRPENNGSGHRLNTIAGSIFITLAIAASAEIEHIPTVSISNSAARPGVMTMGSAVFSLEATMIIAIAMPNI